MRMRDAASKNIARDQETNHNSGLIYAFVDSRITLLTTEIEKYYQEHQAEFSTPEEVTLSEILIADEGNGTEAEARANDIYSRLQKGESFADLATQYSKGSTANKGGSIGAYLLSKLNVDTVKAIAGLKEGEVSKPQKIKEGIIIYRVDTRKVAAISPPGSSKNRNQKPDSCQEKGSGSGTIRQSAQRRSLHQYSPGNEVAWNKDINPADTCHA